MTHILVDWENIVCTNNITSVFSGISYLDKEDELYFFYSETCPKLKNKYYNAILNSGCKTKFCRLQNSGKNALDFYIVTEVGRLVEQGEKEIAILSRDNGYRAVKDYLSCNLEIDGVNLVLADTLVNAYNGFHSERNKDRSKRIRENEESIELDTLLKEQNDLIRQKKKEIKELDSRNKEKENGVEKLLEDCDSLNVIVVDDSENETETLSKEAIEVTSISDSVELLDEKIKDAIKDTVLIDLHNEIVAFACKGFLSPNDLYKAAIHEFGRRNGTEISRLLRVILF